MNIAHFTFLWLILAGGSQAFGDAWAELDRGTLTISHQDRDGNHSTVLKNGLGGSDGVITYSLFIDGLEVDAFNVADVQRIVVRAKTRGVSTVNVTGFDFPDVEIKAAGGGLLAVVNGELGNVSVSGTPKSDAVLCYPWTTTLPTIPTLIVGDVSVRTKGGDDTVAVATAAIADLDINTGGGADYLFLETTYVHNTFKCRMGGSSDEAYIGFADRPDLACIFAGKIDFGMGGGHDNLFIGTGISYVPGRVILNGNGGYDELSSATSDQGIDIRGFDDFPY